MLPKKFINKCLFRLNDTCYYTNVTYSLDVYENRISIFVHIWEPSRKNIINAFHRIVKDEDGFTRFSTDIVDFINDNKKFIK